jgi:hypothetical protein
LYHTKTKLEWVANINAESKTIKLPAKIKEENLWYIIQENKLVKLDVIKIKTTALQNCLLTAQTGRRSICI